MYAISQTSSASAVSGVSWRGGPAVARVPVTTNAAHTWGSQGAQTSVPAWEEVSGSWQPPPRPRQGDSVTVRFCTAHFGSLPLQVL